MLALPLPPQLHGARPAAHVLIHATPLLAPPASWASQVLCSLIMALPGMAAGVAYLLVTRGWRLLRWFCTRCIPPALELMGKVLPPALDLMGRGCEAAGRGLVRFCEGLMRCLHATWHSIVACTDAFRSCWALVLEWVATHCKGCLYALHDTLVAPVVRAVDACLLTPLVGCATALVRCLKPSAQRLAEWLCRECGPACGRAIIGVCQAVATLFSSLDGLLTEGCLCTAELLWRGVEWQWSILGGAIQAGCEWTGKMIDLVARSVGHVLCEALRWSWHTVLLPCGKALYAAVEWMVSQVLTPLWQWLVVVGQAAASMICQFLTLLAKAACETCQAIGQLLCSLANVLTTALSNVLGQLCQATATCLAPCVQAAWSGVIAVGGAIGKATVAMVMALAQGLAAAAMPIAQVVSTAAVAISAAVVAVAQALASAAVALGQGVAGCVEVFFRAPGR